MGWTSYHVEGKINRKNECRKQISDEFKIIKDTIVGSVYYAAVKRVKEPVKFNGEYIEINDNIIYRKVNNEPIFAVVFLTSVDNKDYFNFAYKIIEDSCGPAYYDCPNSILNILSPTDNNWANNWREKCKNQNKAKADLKKMSHGAKIKVEDKIYTKTKYGKKTYWLDGFYFLKPKDIILKGYSVV